jgi:hypothetical protein
LRQSCSHSRGKRSVISAVSSERSWMQVPGTVRTAPRAAGKELLGLVREIDEVFAFIGRAGAERQDGEPVRTGGRLRLDITRIDGAQPLGRRQHRAEAGDGDEQAVVVFGAGTASSSLATAGGVAPASPSASGGASEGQRKTRSIRSCAPG